MPNKSNPRGKAATASALSCKVTITRNGNSVAMIDYPLQTERDLTKAMGVLIGEWRKANPGASLLDGGYQIKIEKSP